MNPAKTTWVLQSALGLAAAAVLALALAAGVNGVTFTAPSAAAVVNACRSFALPDTSFASVMSLALGSLAVAVLMLAVQSTAKQLRASRRFMRTLRIAGSGPGGAMLFEDTRPLAFCAGFFRPRVYLSTAATDALNAGELAAVMEHEAHHARLRDPLRILIARVLSDALFFLPAVRHLADRYSALAELAADGAAVRAGGAQPLASALLTFEAADPVVVGIAPERVDHLLGDRPSWELPLALMAWAVVVLSVVAVIALRVEAARGSALSLPVFAADLCMVSMVVVPLLLGATSLLGARRLLTLGRCS